MIQFIPILYIKAYAILVLRRSSPVGLTTQAMTEYSIRTLKKGLSYSYD